MKALALLTALAVTLFSVAASAQTYGVGKAKPHRRRRLLPKAEQALGGWRNRRPLFFFGPGPCACSRAHRNERSPLLLSDLQNDL
jgi:hypothetical protein